MSKLNTKGILRGLRSEDGIVLPLAMIAFALGVLFVLPLLTYVATTFKAEASARDRAKSSYAAEAAINRVVADLIRGADGISTTYTATSPHRAGSPYDTFTFNTLYTIPSVTINGLTPTVTISNPQATGTPTPSQQYADPGVTNPELASIPAGYGYLVRIYNAKAGVIQVNWAYSPQGVSRIGVWEGVPVNPTTQQPFTPGRIDRWPTDPPILDTGTSPGNATYVRTGEITVTPGVYTIVFDNTRGGTSKTTSAFAPSGGTSDTWIYINGYRDYIISATANGLTIKAYVRQIPGYVQPPTGDFSSTNVSWITNSIYTRTWNIP